MAAFIRMIKQKWITPPEDTTESYAGRNVIVTGATSGIGVEAAAKFVALGASKVIIAARDLEKGEATKSDIEARTGKKDVIQVWQLRMDSFTSVVNFANQANQLDHLDIAILNAGVSRTKFQVTEHGWEEDLQVNTLSTILLGILLLPKLKQSKQHTGKIPILEFVNSGLHQKAKINPDALKDENGILQAYNTPKLFGGASQYSLSKLFLMYGTNKLAEETSSGDVIVTSVCPGMVKTALARDVKFPGVSIVFAIFAFILMKSPEQGSRLLLSGTTQGERIHGRFWQADKIQPIGPSVAGEENKKIALRVWNEIIETLSKNVPTAREALEPFSKK